MPPLLSKKNIISRGQRYFGALVLLLLVCLPQISLARGGGGGSSGGGGGGGGSSSSFHSGSGVGSGGNLAGFLIIFVIFILPVMILGIIVARNAQKKRALVKKLIQDAEAQDSVWNEDEITKHVGEVFLKFQNDWSTFGVESMKTYLTESYLKRMVLELNVLKNEHRQNLVENAHLVERPHLPKQEPSSFASIVFLAATDSPDNKKDTFTAQINAGARDILLDTETNKNLNVDTEPFTEYWNFVREGNEWKLNLISQETEDASMDEPEIQDFAKRNNFFYDPDFGWLMMPNKGVIFSKSNFQTSDINNHVIGYYRDKIVEFYTFIPSPNSTNYVVAQVALPIKYNDILVKKKNRFFNSDPSGLRRIKTESNDFDEKFCLWAHPEDQVSSFELLTPNFMEKIYELPFELNIEVVGSFLYLYAESRKDVDYDKMLEILSWAFDEMKM